ncbi:hypothetical protein SCUP515_11784 [Seiridium cupressi]
MNQGQPVLREHSTGSPSRVVQPTSLNQPAQSTEEEEAIIFDDSSDGDVSMSTSHDGSDDGGNDSTVAAMAPALRTNTSTLVGGIPSYADDKNGRKRKQSAYTLDGSDQSNLVKKARLDESNPPRSDGTHTPPSARSLLPAEIWQHIFTFIPPQGLGILLQVNKLFNSYLDRSPFQCPLPMPSAVGHLSALQPDAIWRAARKRYWPKMPAPLKERTELDMWRLVHNKSCQFCGKVAHGIQSLVNAKAKPGPGTEGVRLIWPFGIRSCGPCLIAHSTKEIDVLLSPFIPSLLLPALPFLLIDSDLQVISPSALGKGHGSEPTPLTKIYLSKQVEGLQNEFLSVKNLGTGAAEEWLKGLEERGKQQRIDTDRWEKWEFNGGVRQLWQSNLSFTSQTAESHAIMQTESNQIDTMATNVTDHNDITKAAAANTDAGPPLQPIMPLHIDDTEQFSPPQSSIQSLQLAAAQPKRTLQEVVELKAARRAEIERRALLLDPPITSSVLAHIPSFQAALQIITPLDDSAWEMLKPRLLLQRADAEQREERDRHTAMPAATAQEPTEERRTLDGQEGKTKELTDKDWDDAQAPLRAQIFMYADEVIRDAWDDGNKVNKESSPRFAATVLLYVRKRFYAAIAKEAATARGAGKEPIRDPPQGPFTQKLTLENMKWLFEVKIKPHTEPFRKELFLCNGCDDSLKAYGFEGVVQHYAAKHTNSMSVGSVVVYWRSEWPEVPPFHPDPMAKNSQSRNTPIAPVHQPVGAAQHHGHSYRQPPLTFGALTPAHISPIYPSQYGPPASQFQHNEQSALYSQPQAPYYPPYPQQSAVYQPGYSLPPGTTPSAAGLHFPPHYPQHTGGFVPATIHPTHTHDAHQMSGPGGYPLPPGGVQSDKMRAQLEELARISREIWMATAGIKELAGYIRVYVFLYHLAKSYRSRFSEKPPLMMFIDGLSDHKEMRPVRNVNGLMCKACHLRLGDPVQVDNERTTFSLPQLVTHFQQKHLEPRLMSGAPLLDWTVDMVFIPEVASLSNLRMMVGIDSHKYKLITEAFPQMGFPGFFNAHIPSEELPLQQHQQQGYMGTSISQLHSAHQPPYHAGNFSAAQPASSQNINNNSGRNKSGDYGLVVPSHLGDSASQAHILEVSSNVPPVELSPLSGRLMPIQDQDRKPSHNNSGRNSPEWQAGRQRNRKATGKERRALSGQGGKSRKGNAKPAHDQGKSATDIDEAEKDKEAEAEAQREEEAIRAMWAADRKATARIASNSMAPQEPQSLRPSLGSPVGVPETMARAPVLRTSMVAQSSAAPHGRHDSPILISDRADDLFANLESHLDQQRTSRPISTTIPESRPTFHQAAVAEERALKASCGPPDLEQSPAQRRGRSRSPVYVGTREAQSQRGFYYQERSPVPHDSETTYARAAPQIDAAQAVLGGRASARPYANDRDRGPLHIGYSAYAEGPRLQPASPVQYIDRRPPASGSRPSHSQASHTEIYERILVRDSRGDEYYVERPIRREPEPVFVRYEDEQRRYREPTMYRGYEQDEPRREPLYQPTRRQGAASSSRESLHLQAWGHHDMPVIKERNIGQIDSKQGRDVFAGNYEMHGLDWIGFSGDQNTDKDRSCIKNLFYGLLHIGMFIFQQPWLPSQAHDCRQAGFLPIVNTVYMGEWPD